PPLMPADTRGQPQRVGHGPGRAGGIGGGLRQRARDGGRIVPGLAYMERDYMPGGVDREVTVELLAVYLAATGPTRHLRKAGQPPLNSLSAAAIRGLSVQTQPRCIVARAAGQDDAATAEALGRNVLER